MFILILIFCSTSDYLQATYTKRQREPLVAPPPSLAAPALPITTTRAQDISRALILYLFYFIHTTGAWDVLHPLGLRYVFLFFITITSFITRYCKFFLVRFLLTTVGNNAGVNDGNNQNGPKWHVWCRLGPRYVSFFSCISFKCVFFPFYCVISNSATLSPATRTETICSVVWVLDMSTTILQWDGDIDGDADMKMGTGIGGQGYKQRNKCVSSPVPYVFFSFYFTNDYLHVDYSVTSRTHSTLWPAVNWPHSFIHTCLYYWLLSPLLPSPYSTILPKLLACPHDSSNLLGIVYHSLV